MDDALCMRMLHANDNLHHNTKTTKTTHKRSTLAIRILLKSRWVSALEACMEALWDVADQVGAHEIGIDRALRAALQAAQELCGYRCKSAPRESAPGPLSQGAPG
jgi:hypothetical protein